MKTYKWIIALVLTLTAGLGWAQDGKGLFESKCNTCHALDRNSTGPKLQGVRAKWEAAGELEFLYEWVKNSKDLISSGKSSMAAQIKDFSPTTMSSQQVSPEEVDAILAYVDGWTPAPKGGEVTTSGETVEVVIVPNYAKNLDMFYVLITLTIFLLIAIIIMSGTVLRLVKSDFFKKKMNERNNVAKTLILLILFAGITASPSYALQFNGPGQAAEGEPWLLIENIDLYVLLSVDIILLFVLLYVRRLFNTFLNMTKKEEELAAAAQEEGEILRKVNQVLTDVVPIEEEHTILMDHEYDGIQELDNNLPPWWVWGFYASIIFAVIYLFNYHVFKTGDLQEAAYEKDMARAEAAQKAYWEKKAMNVDANSAVILTDDKSISAGKAVFSQKCVECHKPDGSGVEGSGPNLTDKYWIYGFEIKDVFTTIENGRPGGMPEHGSKLTPIQIQQVASYVLQLPEKKGVEPKGDIIEE